MLHTDLAVFNMIDGGVQHCSGLHHKLTFLHLQEVIYGEEVWLLHQVSRKLLKLHHHPGTQPEVYTF